MGGVAECLNVIGKAHHDLARYDSAAVYYQRSIELARQLGLKKLIRYNLHDMAGNSAVQGNHEDAYVQLQLYIEYKDSVLNEQTLSRVALLAAHIKEPKEAEESVPSAQAEEGIALQVLVGGLAVLCLLLLFLLFRRRKS